MVADSLRKKAKISGCFKTRGFYLCTKLYKFDSRNTALQRGITANMCDLRQSLDCNSTNVSGGFRGGAVGGNCPPFMMKTQLGAPFLARRAPPILTQMHSFIEFRSELGTHINQIAIKLKNQIIFTEKRAKNFCAPSARLPFAIF